jgi:hypothetical protein
MQRKQLFKPYINFINKKIKNKPSYDFYIRNIFGFLRFKCFWNFSNFKSYFKSFNLEIKKKKNLIDVFYSRYNSFYYMPQLDFVSFHYMINTLTFAYLFVYVITSLFFLKPIFREFYLFYSYPSILFFDVMSLVFLFSDKVIFTQLSRHVPVLSELTSKVRKRWEWYKYIPRMRHPRDPYKEFESVSF